ncbi:MAG: hypothetical protein AAF449_10325 [Myxococcota bacterium]
MEHASVESPSLAPTRPTRSTVRTIAPSIARTSVGAAHVPRSLATQDFLRISISLLNAFGAAAMTAMTVGAGLTAVVMLTLIAVAVSQGVGYLHADLALEGTIALLAVAGGLAMAATMLIGLVNFVLPRVLQFTALLLRAPWFVPSTLLSAPMAALWRMGLWPKESWEGSVARVPQLLPAWSFRSRRYAGNIEERLFEVRQDLFGGTIEIRCPVPSAMPAAYIGPNKIAGAVGVLQPLVACPALVGAELLLRDGQLVIRRQWIRPNLEFVARLVERACATYDPHDLAAELHTITLLAQWPHLRTDTDDRAFVMWFNSGVIARYLELRKTALRANPPGLDVLHAILKDDAIRHSAKAWLTSVLLHRLTGRQAKRLAQLADPTADPIAALAHAPRWPAWIAVHRLGHEGGPDALTALQKLISESGRPSPLTRAARRSVVRIIRRHGGVHTLTGHLSLTGDEGGHLAIVEP